MSAPTPPTGQQHTGRLASKRRRRPPAAHVGAADVGAADVGAADVGAADVGAAEPSASTALGLPLAGDASAERLYAQALLHRSGALAAGVRRKGSNERLELLGDAVLAAAVTEYLMRRYPGEDEGFLSGLRSRLVRGSTLTKLALCMGVDRHIVSAHGAGGRWLDSACEDAFEALVGAVHLAAGYPAARDWVVAAFETHLLVSDIVREHVSSKDSLLREARRRGVRVDMECRRAVGGGYKAVVRSATGELIGAGDGDCAKAATARACEAGLRYLGQ